MDRCPKCDSDTGYRYIARIEMQGAWGEQPESTGGDGGHCAKSVVCIACGFRVSRSKAIDIDHTLGW